MNDVCELLTLDEAISHAEEVYQSTSVCALQHGQLAEWLTDYKKVQLEVFLLRRQIQFIDEELICNDGKEQAIRIVRELCKPYM